MLDIRKPSFKELTTAQLEEDEKTLCKASAGSKDEALMILARTLAISLFVEEYPGYSPKDLLLHPQLDKMTLHIMARTVRNVVYNKKIATVN